MLLYNRQQLGAVVEVTQNTSPTITTNDYLLAEATEPDITVEELKRDLKRTSLDSVASARGTASMKMKVRTELKGGGTRGTSYAPLGAMLAACGMSETATPATSVVYAPVSAAASANFYTIGKSATLSLNMASTSSTTAVKQYKGAGFVGNAKMICEAGKLPMMEFEMSGLYPTITDTTMPSATYVSTVAIPFVNSAVTLHSISTLAVSKIEIDWGNTVAMRESAAATDGVAHWVVTDREPKGTIEIEEELLAVMASDAWARFKAGTSGNLTWAHTGASGNIVTVLCPAVQFGKPAMSNKNGRAVLSVPLQFNQSSGDDWITITIT